MNLTLVLYKKYLFISNHDDQKSELTILIEYLRTLHFIIFILVYSLSILVSHNLLYASTCRLIMIYQL